MATIAPSNRQLRPELSRLLARLRSRIRRYVAIEGGALVLASVAALFWIVIALDALYFWLSRLDLPVALRVGLVVAALSAVALVAAAYLVLRVLRRMHPRALALVLERRFPELDDRLILAVERAEGLLATGDGPLGDLMLARAADDVVAAAERVELADVFDRRPLRRAILLAVGLWAPVILLGAIRPDLFASWRNGFVHFAETYHIRETRLDLTIITPPDDLPRTVPAGGTYKHPRGANLDMLLDVPDGTRDDGRRWVVPERVYAQIRGDSGGRQTISSVKTAERRFRLSIDEVTQSMDLWVTGGDFTTSRPYRIEVVDPPRVESVQLANIYPAHTRLNARAADGTILPDEVTLGGLVASVPEGTWIDFQARTNKPIAGARVYLGPHELAFGTFESYAGRAAGEDGGRPASRRGATLTIQGEESGGGRKVPLPEALAERMIAGDGRSIMVPLLVGGETVSFLPDGPPNRDDLPGGRPVFAIPTRTPIRIVFHDFDQVTSLEPSAFEIRGVPDEPPRIETALRGVSNIITRRAVVPVAGEIFDDYGIASAGFEFRIDGAEEWSRRPFANPPSGLPKEFRLRRDESTPLEWLDTATLNLEIGQELALRIVAKDGDALTGPHVARGEEYVFTIVTEEELLSRLYNQEINLRKRFEQSLAEITSVRDDLAAQRDRSAEQSPSPEQRRQEQTSLRTAADRAFAETQQHAGEVRAVADSFSGLLEQLVNNRVHTENQLDRIQTGILEPLQRLVEEDFPRLDRAVGELRVRISEQEDPGPGLQSSIEAADALIARMNAALQEMQDLAEFHEAIQELTQIMEGERDLLDRTKQEQKRSVIEGLGDLLEDEE